MPGSTPATNPGQSQVEDDRTTNRDSQDSNRTQDIDQGRKDEPETERPESGQQEEQMITVWRCPKCNFYNALGDTPQCMNSAAGCQFDLGYIDDITKCLQQLS